MLVQGERRAPFYQVVGGIWLLVAVYAVIHDQYLVRIAPEHFTIYHPNPDSISSAPLLAAYIALKASVSPGLVLGIVTWFVARAGTRPKLRVRLIFIATTTVLLITEVSASLSGGLVYLTKKPLYPLAWYPDFTLWMLITQTIQITCYFVALLGSVFMLLWMIARRRRMVA
jgi:hypothetical protein